MRAFLKRHGFALALAGGMIAFEALMACMLTFGQPAGRQWLGDTLLAPEDTAQYLSHIRQGDVLFYNLYAVEPQAARFHPLWAALAVLHRFTGASPVLLHELARMLFTIALAFALHAAARSVADTEAHARLASLLAIGGIGLGWLLSILFGALGGQPSAILVAPDAGSAFAIAPSLLGGAQIILSVALLLIAIRGIWKSVHDRTRVSLGVCAAILLLTSFHPYFIPLIAAVITMAWTKKLGRRPAQERAHRPAVTYLLCLLPAAAGYALLLRDPVFFATHLTKKITLFPPPLGFVFALAPAVGALIWLFRRHDREQRFLAVGRWCIVWILAAVVLFFLPVPWSGLFLEGLMIPLVFLTLPAWTALFHTMPKNAGAALLVFLVGITPTTLLLAQIAMLQNPAVLSQFGQPDAVFHAWSFLEKRPRAVILSDDAVANLWTPAWSGDTVWTGHPHETLDEPIKRKTWEDIVFGADADTAMRTLARLPVTDLLLTTPESAQRFAPLARNGWISVFQEGNVTIFERTN